MFDKALKAITDVRRGAGNKLVAQGDSARDRGIWEEAAAHYRAALDQHPDLAPIWVQLGNMLKESGRRDESEEAYRRALALTDDADAHLQLGHLHKIMGRRREAEEDYVNALQRQPDLADARAELMRLGWTAGRLVRRLGKTSAASVNKSGSFVAFELSDLIDHLARTRYPTGIQRVQLALGSAIAQGSAEGRVQFVYYDHMQSDFFEVDRRQVTELADLVQDVELDDQLRHKMALRIHTDITVQRPFEFPDGAYLVNVGTSWGFLNYFLSIREIKRRSLVRYVPLVHDCIPLIYPEFCNPNLVNDFINWITNMIGHADLILTNSENTKADVRKVADELGEQLPPTVTIRLNGEYGTDSASLDSDRDSIEALHANNLDVEDFVLLVSTIEPRKNHMLALNAWSRMIKSRPAARVPQLVCVGSSGWMNEAVHQRIERDRALRERVVIMQNVSEQLLQLLYRRCLFVLFPSLYEGWGLPISEALAHGKIPLVSRVSSHPEAGGDLAVYFDVNSEADFQAKLESLIDDGDARHAREEKIAASPPLRPWADIAKEVFDTIERDPVGQSKQQETRQTPLIACGRHYSFARNLAPSLRLLTFSADIFRSGLNWYAPEPFGCWVRGLSTDIAFSLPPEDGDDFLVYLHWCATANTDNTVTLSVPSSSWAKQVAISQGSERWDSIPLHFGQGSKRDVRIRITAAGIDDFGEATEGRDPRRVSLGVKGLYVARATDSLQRLAIIESIQLNDFDALSRRFGDRAEA